MPKGGCALNNVRIRFSKLGRAAYISHLDMMRCMQRALKRSKIPVWYTQGFNPHMYVTFAMPLSLGFESVYETMDFKLTEELAMPSLIKRLNEALPPEIRVLQAAEPQKKFEDIAFSEYQLTVHGTQPDNFLPLWEAFIAQPEIMSQKKTKKGFKEVNLKDYIGEASASKQEGNVVIALRLTAGVNEGLNPSLLIKAFQQQNPSSFSHITVLRTILLDKELHPFE
ncbi:radical SAM-linked protein [Acetanaerobacterium elongatum]|uniref:Radical SAM-linked protein n=2 Tax=Acetanaerobacterium elongatum TaxID=258515 RepID=A0A1H0ATF2_9FIRM|nr:radical SAM-linked protein [Acetanaerobacterium elongatum]